MISHIGSERPEPRPYKCMITLTSKTRLKPWGRPGWKPGNGWTGRPKGDSIWRGECAALLWKTCFGAMRGCQEQTREGDLSGSPGFGWTGRPKANNILLVRWGVTPCLAPGLINFKFNGVNDASSTPCIKKKIDALSTLTNDVSSVHPQNPATVIARKIRSFVFLPKNLFPTNSCPKIL